MSKLKVGMQTIYRFHEQMLGIVLLYQVPHIPTHAEAHVRRTLAGEDTRSRVLVRGRDGVVDVDQDTRVGSLVGSGE